MRYFISANLLKRSILQSRGLNQTGEKKQWASDMVLAIGSFLFSGLAWVFFGLMSSATVDFGTSFAAMLFFAILSTILGIILARRENKRGKGMRRVPLVLRALAYLGFISSIMLLLFVFSLSGGL